MQSTNNETNPQSVFGKTYQECSTPRTTRSGASWENLADRGANYSRQGNDGETLVVCLDHKEQSRGGSSMPNISEWPNDAAVCLLSQVLETGSIPQKYYLSPKACAGILRRAEKRGKKLPCSLLRALEGIGTLRSNGGDYGGGSENLVKWPADIACTLNAAFGEKQGLENQHIDGGASLFVPCVVHGTQDPCVSDNLAFALGRNGGAENVVQAVSRRDRGLELGEKELANTIRASTGGGCKPHVFIHGIPGNWIGRKPENGGNATEPMNNISPCQTVTDRHAVSYGSHVRRLTPTECERLQGFPDGHTLIPWRNKPVGDCPDGPRYKAIGNSKAVPCIEWIGVRLLAYDMGLLC